MISASNLTYFHQSNAEPSLDNISLNLDAGTRTLLIGANGAGKSTLLQILAGKRLINAASVKIAGRDVFRDASLASQVAFLSTEWAANPVVRSDIQVSAFLDSVGGYKYKERRDVLLDLLDIDLDWRMHQISDGERRRVQLCFGLMTEWTVLLLDEVTVDLDVLVRDQLLRFLKADSQERNATILYATHIYDGLEQFPTHIAHMRLGSLVVQPTPWPLSQSSLYSVALGWLSEDREHRRALEKHGRKTRGARRDQTVPSDSETFYRKYDYSH